MKKNYQLFAGRDAGKMMLGAALKKALLSLGLIAGMSANAQVLFDEQFVTSLGTATAQGGANGNWIFTSTCARSAMGGHTAPGSAFFQGAGCTFGNGGNTVSGGLITPTFAIGAYGGMMSFNYYLENECGNGGGTCTYDVLSVQISNNNGASYTTLMASNTGTFTNGSTWRSVSYAIPANTTPMFRFFFNSIDGAVNAYDGVYVDDILIYNIPACTAAPAAATIVPTTTLVCPVFGTSSFSPSTTYTQGGINYVWYNATNALGPYTAIPNATLQTFTTPTLNTTTYYQMVATCQFGGVSTTLAPIQIDVAATTTNNVPYFEGFEGITQNKQLPNCSWFRSDNYQCGSRTASVNAWRQARTGTKFAEFDASNNVYGQTRYFYSNGIQLYAGITYSASVWYNTIGYSNWNNLTLMYGPNQSPTGLVQLATVSNPNNSTYNSLSNIFNVPTSGLYYACVKATEAYYGTQMVWDDLAIIAPCQYSNNAASIALTSTTSICAGQTISINASGAATYTWSNNQNGTSISVSPGSTTTYSVIGINPYSGCTGVASKQIVVNQLPNVAILAFPSKICEGEEVIMQALSAVNYTWSEGPTFGPVLSVFPTQANNSFTLIGADALGCTNTAVKNITVNPLPVVTASGNTLICEGASANLNATGAGANGSYEWKASTLYLQANPVTVMPLVTTTYSITGTNSNGCKGEGAVTVAVDPCLGLQDINGSASGLSVYPNPNNGVFTVVMTNGQNKTIEVIDVTGRVVLLSTTVASSSDVNISALSNGVYYVKVKSESSSEVVKIVKH